MRTDTGLGVLPAADGSAVDNTSGAGNATREAGERARGTARAGTKGRRSHWWRAVLYVAGLCVSFVLGFVTNIASDRYATATERSALLRPLGWLAYSRAGDVFVARADGSGERRLTCGGQCVGLAWCPEGARLAAVMATSKPRPSLSLWVADLRRGTWEAWVRDLPGTFESDTPVVWAFRADLIAFGFSSKPASAVKDEYVVRVRRTVGRGGAHYALQFFTGCYCPTLDAYGGVLCIRVPRGLRTSDGGAVWQVVSTYHGGSAKPGGPVEYEVLADSRWPDYVDAGYAFESLSLSPSANEIAFISRWNVPGQLWVSSVYDSHRPRTVPLLDRACYARWSPDGTKLLVRCTFCSSSYVGASSSDGVYVVDARSLLCHGVAQNSPGVQWYFGDQCWSYGGKWVLLERGEDHEHTAKYLLNLNTSEMHGVGLAAADLVRLQPVPLDPHHIGTLSLAPSRGSGHADVKNHLGPDAY